jgi:hypothetical protein
LLLLWKKRQNQSHDCLYPMIFLFHLHNLRRVKAADLLQRVVLLESLGSPNLLS